MLILLMLAVCISGTTSASPVRVRGYTRKDGTYVAPHYRSSPDSSKSNNWSSYGNINPFTGKNGTKNGDSTYLPLQHDVWVNGYTNTNGTYVAPHYRSSPDSSKSNNWSSYGNINSFPGKDGTKNHDGVDLPIQHYVWVNGYTKSDGTCVAGYFRSIPYSSIHISRSMTTGNNSQSITKAFTLVENGQDYWRKTLRSRFNIVAPAQATTTDLENGYYLIADAKKRNCKYTLPTGWTTTVSIVKATNVKNPNNLTHTTDSVQEYLVKKQYWANLIKLDTGIEIDINAFTVDELVQIWANKEIPQKNR